MAKSKTLRRSRKLEWICGGIGVAVLIGAYVANYFFRGDWPNQVQNEIPRQTDVLIVLGGGIDRSEIALEAIILCRPQYVLVTGDNGYIVERLEEKLNDLEISLLHEPDASSTYENALFTRPMVKEIDAKDIVVATSWFHGFRALNTFESVFGSKYDIRIFTDSQPEKLLKHERELQRRERFAVVSYFFKYGVIPW